VPACSGVFYDDVFDGVATNVVVPAEIGACAQEPPESAVIQGG
jgi:hypothetical protein